MVTSYEYSIFSRHVYGKNDVNLPGGWSVYLSSPITEDGYAGVAYKNDSTGEVIVSHRGTDDGVDWIFSNFPLAIDNTPAQFADAKEFINQVKAKMVIDLLDLNKITYTGHSLGGALAQMSSANDYLAGLDNKAVVFESPGVTLQMLQDAVGAAFVAPEELNLTNYVAAPNLVNTVNSHFADLIRIYPTYNPNTNSVGEVAYVDYTKQQHDMLAITKLFNSSTGLPKVQSHVQSGHWPHGIGATGGYESYFLSYDNNPHYWNLYFDKKGMSEQQRLDFINTNLGGKNQLAGQGVTIIGDGSDSQIWGGTNKPDTINAGAGDDILNGFGNNDNLIGGSGDDLYITGDGKDIISDSDGQGTIHFKSTLVMGTAFNLEGTNKYTLNGLTLTLNGAELIIEEGAEDRVTIPNFQNGYFGINLQPATGPLVDPEISPPSTGEALWVDPLNYNTVRLNINGEERLIDLEIREEVRVVGDGQTLAGGSENDHILVTKYNKHTLSGGSGHDVLTAADGSSGNILGGGSGFDAIRLFSSYDNVAFGGTGDDKFVVLGGSAGNTLYGGLGNDILLGSPTGGAENKFFGESGDDIIRAWASVGDGKTLLLSGGSGNDRISGEGTMLGGSGDDIIESLGGAVNILNGGPGADILRGREGTKDIFYADSSDTIQNYNPDEDVLIGVFRDNQENERITGTAEDDTIIADRGNDVLIGNGGNDILTGDVGDDKFIISKDGNTNTIITDFENNNPNEKVNLSAFPEITSFADLTLTEVPLEARQENSNPSTIIELTDGQTIRLDNIAPGNLSANNFIFAGQNHAPQVTCNIDNIEADVGDAIAIDPAHCVTDPDGDLLIWEVKDPDGNNHAWMHTNPVTGFITGEVPSAGIHTAIAFATDPGNLFAMLPFNVTGLLGMAPSPAPTPTPVNNPTPTPVATPTPVPVNTPTPVNNPTPTPVATQNPTPTPTPVNNPTPTPVPTQRPTPTPVHTPAPTPVFANTPTPTPVNNPTPTPVATQNPTPTPTSHPTVVPTPTPLFTNAPTPTPVPVSVTNPSPSPAPEAGLIPSPTPSATSGVENPSAASSLKPAMALLGGGLFMAGVNLVCSEFNYLFGEQANTNEPEIDKTADSVRGISSGRLSPDQFKSRVLER